LQNIKPVLVKELMDVLRVLGVEDAPEPCFSAVQRWGAGFVKKPIGEVAIASTDHNIVGCGDFCLGSTAENAMISGLRAADIVTTMLTASRL
jgi:predicted NAD/FAD-dependent oxidoreductase